MYLHGMCNQFLSESFEDQQFFFCKTRKATLATLLKNYFFLFDFFSRLHVKPLFRSEVFGYSYIFNEIQYIIWLFFQTGIFFFWQNCVTFLCTSSDMNFNVLLSCMVVSPWQIVSHSCIYSPIASQVGALHTK